MNRSPLPRLAAPGPQTSQITAIVQLERLVVTSGAVLARPRVGFALLLLVWVPLVLWRAHLETSLWIDETYSLALVSHESSRVVSLTAADAHPPGYYLALKAWLKMARLAGFEPGIFWARLLEVGAWLVLALTAWVGGRRIAGERAGTLIAWMVTGSAYAALHARDLRSYGFASLGLFVTFLGWMALVGSGSADIRTHHRLAAWSAVALGSLFALWSHLLSALALLSMWVVAFVLLLREAPGEGGTPALRRIPWIGLVGTGAIVLVGFLPWLLRVGQQIEFIERAAPTWMTPATWENLVTVFGFWLPFSRIGSPGPPENPPFLTALGLMATLLPFGLALVAGLKTWSAGPSTDSETSARPFGSIAALALSASVLFILTLWCLDRWDLFHVFHGPRYPSLVSSLWAAGLAALAVWAVRRLARPMTLAVVALLPLLGCSLIGQWTLAVRESSWGIAHWKQDVPELFPDPGEPIYVMPSELAPFYRRSLAQYEIRRIEELPCGALEAEEITVLDVNSWATLDRPRDRLARHFLSRQGIARVVKRRKLPEGRDDVGVIHLVAPNRQRFRPLCPAGFTSRLARELSAAAAIGLPEGQSGPDWSWLEISDDLTTGRWATREIVEVSFDGDLPAGEYLLHLVGERQPFPAPKVPMRFEIPIAGWAHRVDVDAGGFHLTLPIRLERTLPVVTMKVEHPTWSPRIVGLSGDNRTLSFMLRAAWFERR